MKINWDSNHSEILINPRYEPHIQDEFRKIITSTIHLPGHIWVATSGSTLVKWVGLSKEAVLATAHAVNEHLMSTAKDIWIHALPDFHVGGLGIWARSYLNGSLVEDFKQAHLAKWHAPTFYQYLKDKKGTLTALVPTQLHDLVKSNVQAPSSLRAVIIGGGHLNSELYLKAIERGWNVLPSYGMTECASQIATAELGSWKNKSYPALKILPHIEVKTKNGRLQFKGVSLLSAYAISHPESIEVFDPKIEGWFISEDRGGVEGNYLQILGRVDQVIKIGGESVDLAKLEGLLQKIRSQLTVAEEMTLVPFPHDRLGQTIHVVVAPSVTEIIHSVIDRFNKDVLPFEKIRAIHKVPFLPRSALSKVLKKELLDLIDLNK